MKKTILTAMLFFAFLVIGTQSASAQYVNTDTASDLLTAEIATTVANETKDASVYHYQANKIQLFTFVQERINDGSTVADAIQLGVLVMPSGNTAAGVWTAATPNAKDPQLTPLHQELEDLLTL